MNSIRSAACAVLLRRCGGNAPLETYLVKRSDSLPFLGGFHAFAGGGVDRADHLVTVDGDPGTSDELSAATCSAALRELFEEVGILALPGAERIPAAERQNLRHAVLENAGAWPRLLDEHGLRVDASALKFMGHWVTPAFSPIRYEAPYFAVWLPDGQQPEIWPGELVSGFWTTAAEAVRRHVVGELIITYPVLETLRLMASHDEDLDAVPRILGERSKDPYPNGGGEMLTGVHMLPLRTFTLAPTTHTNCYILGRTEIVVVDPGTPHSDEQAWLIRYLQALVETGATLEGIWLTHHHPDHIGAVTTLRQRFDIPVAAHALTAAALANDLPVDRILEDDEVTVLDCRPAPPARWRALHTPGHASGHLCFYEERLGTLLSGDNVVGVGTVLVAPPDGNMRDYMASLARMNALQLGMLFPAHGPPVANAAAKIEGYRRHRIWREGLILNAMDTPSTPAEIVVRAYQDVPKSARWLAELSVRSHLEKLLEDGRVRKKGSTFVRAEIANGP